MSAAAGQGQAALALESLSWKQVGVPEHMLGKLPKIGVENPTPVQASAIPLLRPGGRGAVITAPTGTGKTLAYAIPLAARVLELHASGKTLGSSRQCRAVVVVPTRELARQVQSVLDALLAPPQRKAKKGAVGPVLRRLVGEVTQARLASLATDPPAVVVGTPRTLAALIPQHLSLQGCAAVVLDEADHLLTGASQGPTTAILKAASRLKERPWVALVTATVTPAVDAAASRYLRAPKAGAGPTTGLAAAAAAAAATASPQAASSASASSGAAAVPSVDLSRTDGRWSLAPGVVHTGVLLPTAAGPGPAGALVADDDMQPGSPPAQAPVSLGADEAGSPGAGAAPQAAAPQAAAPQAAAPQWREPAVIRRTRAAGLLLRGKAAIHVPGRGWTRIRGPALAFASRGAEARQIHAALAAGADRLPFALSGSELLAASEPGAAESGVDALLSSAGLSYRAVLDAAASSEDDAKACIAAWRIGTRGREAMAKLATEGEEVFAGKPRARVVNARRALALAERTGHGSLVASGGDLRSAGATTRGKTGGDGWELLLQGTVNRDRARALRRLLAGQSWAAMTTDHMGRGVDLPGLRTVMCLDVPAEAVAYLHRAGRVGRVRSKLQAATRASGERARRASDGRGGRPGHDEAVIVDADDAQPLWAEREGGRSGKTGAAAFAFGRVLTLLENPEEAARWRRMMEGFAYPVPVVGHAGGVSAPARAELVALVPGDGPSKGSRSFWKLQPVEKLEPGVGWRPSAPAADAAQHADQEARSDMSGARSGGSAIGRDLGGSDWEEERA
ncbi:hypothetical protein FNF27_00214 [Cafeteria roenbergensis]|uniref:RNA helicase n=1 Tax=Cafeteria roenbergensis TaxID=33653 RepID=A0A5A8ELX4_CAFRO|nr:hypothetical protein FNF27_00214 [Cafeteria roenbergensis]